MNKPLAKLGLAIVVGIILVPLMLTAQGHGGSSGKSKGPDLDISDAQRDAIVKADHKRNLEDAAALLKLAGQLKSDLDIEDPFVTSVTNIKRTEDIEKLAKAIHGRLKHN